MLNFMVQFFRLNNIVKNVTNTFNKCGIIMFHNYNYVTHINKFFRIQIILYGVYDKGDICELVNFQEYLYVFSYLSIAERLRKYIILHIWENEIRYFDFWLLSTNNKNEKILKTELITGQNNNYLDASSLLILCIHSQTFIPCKNLVYNKNQNIISFKILIKWIVINL